MIWGDQRNTIQESRNSTPTSDGSTPLSFEVVVIMPNINSPDHDQDEQVQDDFLEEGLCYRGY